MGFNMVLTTTVALSFRSLDGFGIPRSHSWRYQVGGAMALHKSMPIYTLNPFDISRYCMAASKSRAPGKLSFWFLSCQKSPPNFPDGQLFFSLPFHLISIISIIFDRLCLKTLEAFYRHMLDQCKHLLLSILILVALPGQAHAHTPRHIADTVAPKELVQLRVDAHVLRQHDLGGKLPHHSHSSRCSLLEGDLLHVFVKMNGAISGHRLLARTGSLLLFLHHDHTSQSKHDEVWAKMASRKVDGFLHTQDLKRDN